MRPLPARNRSGFFALRPASPDTRPFQGYPPGSKFGAAAGRKRRRSASSLKNIALCTFGYTSRSQHQSRHAGVHPLDPLIGFDTWIKTDSYEEAALNGSCSPAAVCFSTLLALHRSNQNKAPGSCGIWRTIEMIGFTGHEPRVVLCPTTRNLTCYSISVRHACGS